MSNISAPQRDDKPIAWFIWVETLDRYSPQIVNDPTYFEDEGIRGRVVAKHPISEGELRDIATLSGRFPAPPKPVIA